ncbi:MAG: hypothetical protein JST51_00180 [Armatimonadetes bacterium]|nr:hypothetical protein [Armatimonadota bacterium]
MIIEFLLFALAFIILSTLADLVMAQIRIPYWKRRIAELGIPEDPSEFVEKFYPEGEISADVEAVGDALASIFPIESDVTLTVPQLEACISYILTLPVGPIVPPKYIGSADETLVDLMRPCLSFAKSAEKLVQSGAVQGDSIRQCLLALQRLLDVYRETPFAFARIVEYRTLLAYGRIFAVGIQRTDFRDEGFSETLVWLSDVKWDWYLERMVLSEISLSYYYSGQKLAKDSYERGMLALAKSRRTRLMRLSSSVRYYMPWTVPVYVAAYLEKFFKTLEVARRGGYHVTFKEITRAFNRTRNPFSLFTPLINERRSREIIFRSFEMHKSRRDFYLWLRETLEALNTRLPEEIDRSSEFSRILVRREGGLIRSQFTFLSHIAGPVQIEVSWPVESPPIV